MSGMRTFELNKLVRDGIVGGHEEIGGTVVFDTLEGEELRRALLDKIEEEFTELKSKPGIDLDELADIKQIVDDLAKLSGSSKTEIESVQYDKRRRIGGFTAGHFVHTVTIPADSELADYYSSDPGRFPEIK